MRTFLSRLPVRRRAWRVPVALVVAAGLALPASKAVAEPIVLDTHMPFSFATLNLCMGEFLTVSGFLHFKVTQTTTPNVHVSVEQNIESAKGVTASGVRYVVPTQTATHMIIDSDGAPANATEVLMLQLIRQAKDGSLVMGDDFYLHVTMHVTVNANGEMTVSFSDLTFTCH